MKLLYIWKLTRTDKWTYDDYDSCIVAAYTEADARQVTPQADDMYGVAWPEDVSTLTVQKLGVVTDVDIKAGDVLLASFNAG